MPEGPVVASGGAPREMPTAAPTATGMQTYPEGVPAPAQRYYTDYGLGHPYLMAPPWSTIIAYDLNRGVIKWKKPLGQDRAVQIGLLARAAGYQQVRALDARLADDRAGGAVPLHGAAVVAIGELGESAGVDVDDGELVLLVERIDQGLPDVPGAEHDDLHVLRIRASRAGMMVACEPPRHDDGEGRAPSVSTSSAH